MLKPAQDSMMMYNFRREKGRNAYRRVNSSLVVLNFLHLGDTGVVNSSASIVGYDVLYKAYKPVFAIVQRTIHRLSI